MRCAVSGSRSTAVSTVSHDTGRCGETLLCLFSLPSSLCKAAFKQQVFMLTYTVIFTPDGFFPLKCLTGSFQTHLVKAHLKDSGCDLITDSLFISFLYSCDEIFVKTFCSLNIPVQLLGCIPCFLIHVVPSRIKKNATQSSF